MQAEDLLPPSDFDSVTYSKGWLVVKKRKLVNVDVVWSIYKIMSHQKKNIDEEEIDASVVKNKRNLEMLLGINKMIILGLI